mgnify:CR=1 FL=1
MADQSAPQDNPAKAWSGRFSEPVADLVKRYTASVFFDKRMAAQDIRGSLAHAKMLARQGIIGAQDLADIERGNLLWGVVTNKSARFTEPLTFAMPLFATAGAVVSGDSTPHAKPHPAPLLEAASRLGLNPDRCIYVGDDHRDIVAGLAAGMGTVAATYGYLGDRADPLQWGAHAVINSPLDLLQLLEKA